MTSALFTRRMIRRYTDQPIPRTVLDDLLAAATRAPSPHNRQPWRFAVITGEARARIAQTMGDQLRRDLAADGLPAEVIEKDAARSAQRITSAQAGILVCLSMADMDVYPDVPRNAAEHWMAGQAAAAAAQNILLRATELGLGACWMCAPLFCPNPVAAALHLPSDWEPQVYIALGYPADAGKDRERKPLEAISMWVDF